MAQKVEESAPIFPNIQKNKTENTHKTKNSDRIPEALKQVSSVTQK